MLAETTFVLGCCYKVVFSCSRSDGELKSPVTKSPVRQSQSNGNGHSSPNQSKSEHGRNSSTDHIDTKPDEKSSHTTLTFDHDKNSAQKHSLSGNAEILEQTVSVSNDDSISTEKLLLVDADRKASSNISAEVDDKQLSRKCCCTCSCGDKNRSRKRSLSDDDRHSPYRGRNIKSLNGGRERRSPFEDRKRKSHIEHRKRRSPLSDRNRKSPIEDRRRRSPFGERKRKSPIEERKRISPVDNRKRTSSIERQNAPYRKRKSPFENRKRKSPIEDRERKSPTGDIKRLAGQQLSNGHRSEEQQQLQDDGALPADSDLRVVRATLPKMSGEKSVKK